MKNTSKYLSAAFLGNALEFYDFSLFGFLTPIFVRDYFNVFEKEKTALVSSLSLFAIGFLIRPAGALFFGCIGDKIGRKRSLIISISIMSFSSFAIAILPTYNHIGIIAPIILLILRLLQGFSTGGEYTGASIFLMEHFPENKKGFSGSLIVASCALGVCIAVFVSKIVLAPDVSSWLWRIAYLIGASLGILGYYIRKYLNESQHFQNTKPPEGSVKQFLSQNTQNILLSIGLSALACVLINITVVFLGLYISKLGVFSISEAFKLVIIGLCCFVVVAPIIGTIADRTSIIKSAIWIQILVVILGVPIFYNIAFANENLSRIIAVILLSILASGYAATTNAVLFSIFPTRGKYKGMALSFNIAMGLFGGTTPLICFYLIDSFQDKLMPGYFISIIALVFLPVTLWINNRGNLSSRLESKFVSTSS